MKKIIPIFLFIIISVNHLHLLDTVMDWGLRLKKEHCQKTKTLISDEESETEKESKGKEKIEEHEKYFLKNTHIINRQFQLSDKDKFSCFSAKLNIHPYQEDDIQPPKAV